MNDVSKLINSIAERRFEISEPFGMYSDYISGFDDCACLVMAHITDAKTDKKRACKRCRKSISAYRFARYCPHCGAEIAKEADNEIG